MRKSLFLSIILFVGFSHANQADCEYFADAAMHEMNIDPTGDGFDRWMDLMCQYDC